ncbi:MAG TPA: TonB family protein [Vicinamibacteria bacterium]|nr:TonB family protein [Vicinamibacteria bacterium]
MPKKEKFGKFVLLDEVETTGLGTEYRAAKLSPTGLEKIVAVLRVRPNLSANAETVKSLMEQVKFAAQLQNANIVKLFGAGKIDASFYISHEFIEAKSLQAVFNRGRQEGFPFSVDHALLIVSKVCSALEYAHARKTEGGVRYFHGMVTPSNVIVSYEGEVRTRGFGYWPARVREAGGLTEEETMYLAPEQAAGGVGDTRSDLFAVGALLFQMLTGEAFFQGGRAVDIAKRVADAKLLNPTTDDDALPKPIREILRRSLTQDPAERFAEVQEMRKGVDTLLFSGDFAPTTFNLAFFMHSLFRDDIDRQTKTLKEEREASYLEYITEDVRNAPATLPPMPAPSAAAIAAAGAAAASASASPNPVPAPVAVAASASPGPVPSIVARPAPAEAPRPSQALPLVPPPPKHAAAAHAGASGSHAPASSGSGAGHAAVHPPDTVSAREAAAGFTFHKGGKTVSKMPLIGGLAAVLLIAAVGAALVLKGRGAAATPSTTTPPPTTMSAEMIALSQKAKDLEAKLQALEAEKAAASAKAEEDARKKVEAQARARGQAVDPEALARAQDDARKKAQAEQDRKAQADRKRLEDEQKAAETQLAEEQRRAEEARTAAAAAAAASQAPPTTVAAAPPPPTTVAVKPGSLVDVNDAGVIAPVALNKPSFTYPPIALRQRIEGKVDLTVLVDERGGVADARVVSGAGGKAGLNEAASEYVRRWKFRPATKEGVPVRTWTPVSVVFMLPR